MPDGISKSVMLFDPERAIATPQEMISMLVDDLATGTSKNWGYVGNMGMPSHTFTASRNSCWDMERLRLGLGIARNHASEVVPVVFR